MWRTWALGAALALGGFVSAQSNGSPAVGEAVSEIMAMLPKVECAEPEVWEVEGDARGAARFLLNTLRERGWSVMEHGPTRRSYALIVDPNPNDPVAVAIAGYLVNTKSKQSTAFLAECKLTSSDAGGDMYTYLSAPNLVARR